MIVILHIEDDRALGALVALTLEGLGFAGKRINAHTVDRAEAILDEAARKDETFDLIISDMHLPDGTGLDLVRHVRENPKWRHTPMLILSGDVDPKMVSRAYALGANAYISKFPPGRSFFDVVSSLYHHWIEDVVMPGADDASAADVTRKALRRSMNIRLRHAHIYQKLAERFVADTADAAFWINRALVESNLINLLGMVQQQLPERTDLEPDIADEIATIQTQTEAQLSAFERDLESQTWSREEICARVIALLSIANVDAVARSMGRTFPIVSLAIDALRDFLLANYEAMTSWVCENTHAPELRQKATEVREIAIENRAVH